MIYALLSAFSSIVICLFCKPDVVNGFYYRLSVTQLQVPRSLISRFAYVFRIHVIELPVILRSPVPLFVSCTYTSLHLHCQPLYWCTALGEDICYVDA